MAANPTSGGAAPDPELVLAHVDSLPTLAPVAVQVLRVTADPTVAADDLVRVLRGDQSLTAKLLAVASSAAMGVGTVGSLDQAVVLLGFRAVRSMVLSIKVFECFAVSGAARRTLDRAEFWKHSVAVACAARRLANAQPSLGIDAEDAFVAGLLHDLGKVALDALFPKSYERIAALAEQTRGDIADGERALLGVDHTVAGRRLAERWRLPASLRDVIWLHHLAVETLPPSVSAPRLIGLVQLADTLVREQRIGYSGNHVFYDYSDGLAARLGVPRETLDRALPELARDVSEQIELLGLGRESPESLYLHALTRANEELGRLNQELVAGHRRLAAAARYFDALIRLDHQLSAWSDLADVVAAMAAAGVIALQRQRLALFGVYEATAAVELCWLAGENDPPKRLTLTAPPNLDAWRAQRANPADALVQRLPAAARGLIEPALPDLGPGEAWLLPISHSEQVVGGFVFASEHDERSRLSGEVSELRSFLTSLGLALGRANAQAAARRLADDLADTNRRLQQMQAQLLRSRTLSMIAEMAAGAGHELNSPLTVISGRAQLLAQQIEHPEARRALQLIHAKAHECSRIVSELMDFARPRPPRLASVELAPLLREVRDEWLAQAQQPASRIVLEVSEPAGGMPLTVPADREQLKLVFFELVKNALEATAGNAGTVTIRAVAGLGREPLTVLVRDTGCGMAPGVLERAFDPFFSHRTAGRGRGLGLARVHRIIEAHGGRIWLESRPDEGTCAHVTLPAAG